MTVAVPQLQRVIAHQAFAECLLIASPRFPRVGEIVGEICPDESGARTPGHYFRRCVHVGDLAVWADRNQRIETGFQESPVVGL